MDIDGTTLILIFWFLQLSAWPQLTLFQPGEGRLSPSITAAPPPLFFTFRHHWAITTLLLKAWKVRGLFSIVEMRVIIISDKQIEIFGVMKF